MDHPGTWIGVSAVGVRVHGEARLHGQGGCGCIAGTINPSNRTTIRLFPSLEKYYLKSAKPPFVGGTHIEKYGRIKINFLVLATRVRASGQLARAHLGCDSWCKVGGKLMTPVLVTLEGPFLPIVYI